MKPVSVITDISLEDTILGAIRERINAVTNEEIDKQIIKITEGLKQRLKEELGKVAVSLATHFHVERGAREIIVTYEEKDGKK